MYRQMVERAGYRALALKTDLERPPTAGELKPLLTDLDIVAVRLTA